MFCRIFKNQAIFPISRTQADTSSEINVLKWCLPITFSSICERFEIVNVQESQEQYNNH